MSAVNSTTFANRKPNLTGALITTVGTPQFSSGGNGNLSGLQGGDVLVTSQTFTPTESTNLIILNFSIYATNDVDISIKEGATTLATFNAGATGTRTLTHVVEDATVASHTYTYNLIRDTTDYQYGASGGFGNNGPIVYGVVVDIDNTQSTKNANIIRG